MPAFARAFPVLIRENISDAYSDEAGWSGVVRVRRPIYLTVVFSSLYATILPPAEVSRVMNFCTAVGIIVSVTVVYAHKRSSVKPDAPAGEYLAGLAAFYSTLALAIWFFIVWFRLLLLSDGESVSFSDDVVWSLVSVLNPLALGGAGAFLWKSARRR